MSDRQSRSVIRHGDHLRERPSLEHPDNRVPFRVQDGDSGRFLRIDVVTSSVIGYPQIFTFVGESRFDWFPRECPRIPALVLECVIAAFISPQLLVRTIKPMMDSFDFLSGRNLKDNSPHALQRIDVELRAIRMDGHRFRRADICVTRLMVRTIILSFLDQSHFNILCFKAFRQTCRMRDTVPANGGNNMHQ